MQENKLTTTCVVVVLALVVSLIGLPKIHAGEQTYNYLRSSGSSSSSSSSRSRSSLVKWE